MKAYIAREWRDRSDGWDDSVQTLLIGADPSDPRALWQKLRGSTFWSARAGACYAALAGVDMALWDLAGKIHGVPTWQLLGEQRNDELRAYVTLYHGRGSFREALPATLETADVALAAGYTAFKVEAVPENTDTPG